MILKCLVILIVNFILYFIFGCIITGRKAFLSSDGQIDGPMTVLAGFFLYYALFELAAVPIMYRWRPLSLLSTVWIITTVIITCISIVLNRKLILSTLTQTCKYIKNNRVFIIGVALLLLVQIAVVLYSYQFTLDAAYYVANVTTSVQTNMLNIYDPYTGDWQDHFEMRYFFATYPLQDAVVCVLTGIPALLQTKLIMASVSLLLTNLMYYLVGRELFGDENKKAIFFMLLFAGVMNFFFISIYTTSGFLLTRTYEGKSILGNVILPAILFFYIRIYKQWKVGEKSNQYWWLLLLVSFGSLVISNSSNMLVPAALSVLFVPFAILQIVDGKIKEGFGTIAKMVAVMIPCLVLVVMYVAYVRGMFVLYTYPR